jgi:ectoine hydroxylase-related dioxygenase (phytanoyl-CoA dioxygenase family)
MSAWDDACLNHLLTDDERDAFEHDGYLLVRDALGTDVLSPLLDAAARSDAAFRRQREVGPHHVLNEHDLIGRDDVYLELVDPPTTFPKVWGILGWHIQLFHTQLLVTPPAPAQATSGAYGWHQDNNRMNLDLETTPQPRVSLKVGYFLTDLPRTGMGNLCVVPGSHARGRPGISTGQQPDDAVEVLARAGDAIIFDRRLWHSASTNRSDTTRVFLTVGYSYRWLRPKSRMDLGHRLDELPPIRRQLLGATTSANAWFDPTEDDVPLRAWIHDHVGAHAVSP